MVKITEGNGRYVVLTDMQGEYRYISNNMWAKCMNTYSLEELWNMALTAAVVKEISRR